MSCGTQAKAIATISGGQGISSANSQGVFYAAVAAGALLGSLFVARRLKHKKPGQKKDIPSLTGQKRIKPISTDRLNGQNCAGCREEASKKRGAWYSIQGRVHCQDCAPGAAQKAGVQLLGASGGATAGETGFRKSRFSRRVVRVNLKPMTVRTGLSQVEGYRVLDGRNRDTGLDIAPAFKINESGQALPDRRQWFVHYRQAGSKPLAGPYKELKQAKAMRSQLPGVGLTRRRAEFSTDAVG